MKEKSDYVPSCRRCGLVAGSPAYPGGARTAGPRPTRCGGGCATSSARGGRGNLILNRGERLDAINNHCTNLV